MKKYLIITILSVLIISSVAFASWKIFYKTDTKTQTLENRILELENKLNNTTTSTSAPEKPTTTTSTKSTNTKETSVVKKCRPETKITRFPPYEISDGINGMDTYFMSVIYSNASLVDLQYIRETLVSYKEKTINDMNDVATGTTDPYKRASQSGISYSPEELSAIEGAYANTYIPIVNYYESWIQTTDEIIKDKKDNNCIDGELTKNMEF